MLPACVLALALQLPGPPAADASVPVARLARELGAGAWARRGGWLHLVGSSVVGEASRPLEAWYGPEGSFRIDRGGERLVHDATSGDVRRRADGGPARLLAGAERDAQLLAAWVTARVWLLPDGPVQVRPAPGGLTLGLGEGGTGLTAHLKLGGERRLPRRLRLTVAGVERRLRFEGWSRAEGHSFPVRVLGRDAGGRRWEDRVERVEGLAAPPPGLLGLE